MLDTIKCRFPCGGYMKVECYRNTDAGTSVGEENFNRFFVPEIRCKGRYVEGKGCPWFEELRKFYGRIPDPDMGMVDADSRVIVMQECYEDNAAGKMARIVDSVLEACLVIRRGKLLYDAHFPPVHAKTEQKFECCNKKSFHAGIISKFIAWLKGE